MTTLRVRDGENERRFGPADFPLPLGGPGSAVAKDAAPGPVAWLGLEGGEVFVQPVAGASVLCNGTRLAASHWLRDGDVLRLPATSLEVRLRGDGVELRVAELGESNPTEPPLVLVPPPRGAKTLAAEAAERTIAPIPFTPRPLRGPALSAPRRAPSRTLVALALVVLAAGALLLLLSRLALVEVQVTPVPDRLALRGDWPTLRLGGRRLAVSGRYTLVAEKEGYRRLEVRVDVERGAVLRHALSPLPGRLAVETPGLAGAEVVVDGEARGTTPLPAFELEPGERALLVRADGYEEHRASVVIAGRGALQSLAVTLVPLPTPPPGPPPPPRPGLLVLSSEPPGARVILEGSDRGETPLELRLAPGRRHEVRLTKPGHADAELAVELRAGERREASGRLEPQLGEVRFAARPPDAELLIDGVARGRADQTLQLLAVPHAVEVRREGFETARDTVTPRPGFPQTVSLALQSLQQAREAAMPRLARSPEGHELRLVEGGRFRMGAPRREPGRRANEPLRDVELVRPFYVATREVSNQQFRRYEAQHSSGRVGDESLDVDTQPAVNLTWQKAALYCNWLSERERLPPAYVERGGKLVAAVPLTTGYRLPTEAEWERVARYSATGGQGPLKYPWGPALPVPPGVGNYADMRARGLVSQVLEGYEDGFRASAPVDHFAPNALGFVGLGDNVAEWAHDLYTLTPSVEGQLVRDPLGPAEGEYHVIRGASYLHGTVTELRLSFRDYGKDARPDVGFRVARYAQ